jgi:hypothetical protein
VIRIKQNQCCADWFVNVYLRCPDAVSGGSGEMRRWACGGYVVVGVGTEGPESRRLFKRVVTMNVYLSDNKEHASQVVGRLWPRGVCA